MPASMVDFERYFRKLDLLHNRVKVTNDAARADVCSCESRRGRGNVLLFDGVEVASFGHFDIGGVSLVTDSMSLVADFAWMLSRTGRL